MEPQHFSETTTEELKECLISAINNLSNDDLSDYIKNQKSTKDAPGFVERIPENDQRDFAENLRQLSQKLKEGLPPSDLPLEFKLDYNHFKNTILSNTNDGAGKMINFCKFYYIEDNNTFNLALVLSNNNFNKVVTEDEISFILVGNEFDKKDSTFVNNCIKHYRSNLRSRIEKITGKRNDGIFYKREDIIEYFKDKEQQFGYNNLQNLVFEMIQFKFVKIHYLFKAGRIAYTVHASTNGPNLDIGYDMGHLQP